MCQELEVFVRYIGKPLSILFLLSLMSCSTILGPEGSEPGLSPDQPLSFSPYEKAVEGEPNLRAVSVRKGYYVWTDRNVWHVRIVRPDGLGQPRIFPVGPIFAGTIVVEGGGIIDLVRLNTTAFDEIRYGGREVRFRFDPRNDIEGFNLTIVPTGPEHCVTTDLLVDGAAAPELVHLGRTMLIPNVSPIRMCFHY